MGRLKSIIDLRGTIDGITFYKIKGIEGTITRRKAGPTSEQVKTASSYERTRENSKEFGIASKAGKILRRSLNPFTRNIGSSYVSGELTRIFQQMVVKGDGIRGKRSLKPRQHKELLLGFDFNAGLSLQSVLRLKPEVHFTEKRTGIHLTFDSLNLKTDIFAPSGATHIEFIHAACIQPALVFNLNKNEYDYSTDAYTILQEATLSERMLLDRDQNIPLELRINFHPSNLIHEDSLLISVLGIRFYQQIGFHMYLLESGKAMRIIALD
jgi:hypothetical protein